MGFTIRMCHDPWQSRPAVSNASVGVSMMRRPAIVLIAIAALTLGSALPSVVNLAVAAEPAAVASGGTWGTAQKVPGLAALGALSGEVTSVSCASAGNCAAGGDYGDGRYLRAFVINEVNGIWSNALRVPGIDVLSGGRGAGVVSVSCVGPGNCAAAGSYMTSRGGLHGFVVSEVNGSWQKALQVPGLAALDKAGIAETMSVSCSAAGSCAAGGNYYNDGIGSGAFVVSASNGLWRTALPVRFASKVGIAQIWSVSCRRPGYCAAGGHYFDGLGRNQAFVVSQVNGAWRKALEVPGSAVLNTGGVAEVLSVSCGGPTSCAAGGYYEDSATRTHPFVVNRVNGTWRAALQVPGLPATDNGGGVKSISCGVPGNYAAAGNYTDAAGNSQGFVVNEVNGAWRKAIDVPGLRALNLAGHAGVVSLSCGAADNCAAGGYYTDQIYSQAFIVGER